MIRSLVNWRYVTTYKPICKTCDLISTLMHAFNKEQVEGWGGEGRVVLHFNKLINAC